jgi:hypothetical protein
VLRPALFIAVGVGFGVLWLHSLTGPDNQDPVSVSDWFATLGFSVALIGLAAALPVFGRLFGEPVVFRVSLVPAVGAALGGVANILEDGLQLGWAFWFFVLGSGLSVLGLAALAVVIAFIGRGGGRLMAAVPAGTLVGQLLFPVGGGVLMLVAWLGAAAFVLGRAERIGPVAAAGLSRDASSSVSPRGQGV